MRNNKGITLGKELEKIMKLKEDTDRAYERSEDEYIESFIKLSASIESVASVLRKVKESKSKEEVLTIINKVNLNDLDKQLNKVYQATDAYEHYSNINRLFNEK